MLERRGSIPVAKSMDACCVSRIASIHKKIDRISWSRLRNSLPSESNFNHSPFDFGSSDPESPPSNKMPFLGILDDKKLPHIPGTVILEETAAHSQELTGGLKHGTGRNANIVLIPQPSNDPNDPLNWPQSKKLTALGITCIGAVLYAAVVSAMLNAAFFNMSIEINTTIPKLVQTSGYQTLVIGVTGPLFSALSRKWGNRAIFVIAAVMCLVANIVGSCVKTYEGVLASRILQGFAIAPYESLIFTLISDMFFVHERGLYASIINFILAGISNLTGVVAGPIASNLGWSWL